MSSSRFLLPILAAGLLAASACSDSPRTTPSGILAPAPAASVTLYGVISKTGRDPLHALDLILEDGSVVRLVSNVESSTLSTVDSGGVEVRGNWDSDGAFEVVTFFVRQMHGAAVLDGVILEQQLEDAGDDPVFIYRLQPSDGSDARPISPSAEMLRYLGMRMWVRLDNEGTASEFGIIG